MDLTGRKRSRTGESEHQSKQQMLDNLVSAGFGLGFAAAPKVLGDLLEAIAGAVLVDCGNDLETLWKVTSEQSKGFSPSSHVIRLSLQVLSILHCTISCNVHTAQPGATRAIACLTAAALHHQWRGGRVSIPVGFPAATRTVHAALSPLAWIAAQRFLRE